MSAAAQRICSLLPSATEIAFALDLGDRVVGVTHECDYPSQALTKPQVTASVIDSGALSAREIDQAVRDNLADQDTIYHLDRDLLEDLQPDLILTQELCTVCAVGTHEVRDVAASLSSHPKVVSLEPRTLREVLDSILLVGRLAGVEERALQLVSALERRLARVQEAVAAGPKRRVLTLEWIDPLFIGGHWVPEMVEIAGGRDVLGRRGEYSREASWSEVVAAQPEVVVAMPCGFGLTRSQEELASAAFPAEWEKLPAVQLGLVYAVDGSSYFNRPGPRLVDGVEILATILHPEEFSQAPPDSYAQFSAAVSISP